MSADQSPPMGAVLLLGYGSRGRACARSLSTMAKTLAIVDTNQVSLERAKSDHPTALTARDLGGLDQTGFVWSSACAVIATWGPSHADLFHGLVDRGVRRILCEKPLAASVEQADGMVRRAARDAVFLTSYHYFRHAGFPAGMSRLAKLHDLGDPVGAIVHGGAACLVTNGIHFVDFAIDLFGSFPERVISTCRGDKINPRSVDLQFYGGSAAWTFSGGRELTMALSNHSSVMYATNILYRDAVAAVQYRDDVETNDFYYEVRVARRDMAAVRTFPAVTRTGPAVDVLFNGELPGVLRGNDAGRLAFTQLASGVVNACPGESAAASVNACIGALVSGREGKTVELPIPSAGPWGREVWPIS